MVPWDLKIGPKGFEKKMNQNTYWSLLGFEVLHVHRISISTGQGVVDFIHDCFAPFDDFNNNLFNMIPCTLFLKYQTLSHLHTPGSKTILPKVKGEKQA